MCRVLQGFVSAAAAAARTPAPTPGALVEGEAELLLRRAREAAGQVLVAPLHARFELGSAALGAHVERMCAAPILVGERPVRMREVEIRTGAIP